MVISFFCFACALHNSRTKIPLLALQMLVEERKYVALILQIALVWLGFYPRFKPSAIAPNLVHAGESLLYTRNREKLVFVARDEQHRLGSRQRCDVGIIHIVAEQRNAVGKAAILLPSILQRELVFCGDHPTNGTTNGYIVAQG